MMKVILVACFVDVPLLKVIIKCNYKWIKKYKLLANCCDIKYSGHLMLENN